MEERPIERALGTAGRIVLGPWPIYPRAILLIVLFSLVVRGATRLLNQPEGAAPAGEMTLLIGITTITVAIVFWGVASALARVPTTRARSTYLATLLVISLVGSGTLIILRVVLPDGAVESRAPVAAVLLATLVITFTAVFATNGLMGYTIDRLRRQEEAVRAERSLLLASDERVRADTARFLHDSMQSTLLRATMRLAMIEREDLSPEARQQLRVVIDELDDVREDSIRGVGRRLSPPLSTTGLLVSITELVATYDGTMAIAVVFDDAAAERFRQVGPDDRAALAVYRIVEQGLQNALKHGHAESVRVEIESAGESTTVRVIDDGSGIAAVRSAGSGTAVISAWVDDVGGAWDLRPGRAGGAVLEARLLV